MRDAIFPYLVNHLSLSSYNIVWGVSPLKGYSPVKDVEAYLRLKLARATRKMVDWEGFEPPTPAMPRQYSYQLNYQPFHQHMYRP